MTGFIIPLIRVEQLRAGGPPLVFDPENLSQDLIQWAGNNMITADGRTVWDRSSDSTLTTAYRRQLPGRELVGNGSLYLAGAWITTQTIAEINESTPGATTISAGRIDLADGESCRWLKLSDNSYFNFEDTDSDQAATLLDSSGNGNHLTVTNGFAGMLANNGNVLNTADRNEVGYNEGDGTNGAPVGTYIPIDKSGDGTTDIYGNAASHPGRCPAAADVTGVGCLVGNASMYLQLPAGTTATAITSYSGTAAPTWDNTNKRINIADGESVLLIVLDNGNSYPACEGAGGIVHDVVNSENATIVNQYAGMWGTTDNAPSHPQEVGAEWVAAGDGATGYINTGYTYAEIPTGRLEFTATLVDTGNFQGVVDFRAGALSELAVIADWNGTWSVTGPLQIGAVPFVSGKTVQGVWTWTGTTQTLTIDGIESATGTFTPPAGTEPLNFGLYNGRHFSGDLSSVRLYDAVTGGNLIRHWPLNDGPGASQVRETVTGVPGEITGTIEWVTKPLSTGATGNWVRNSREVIDYAQNDDVPWAQATSQQKLLDSVGGFNLVAGATDDGIPSTKVREDAPSGIADLGRSIECTDLSASTGTWFNTETPPVAWGTSDYTVLLWFKIADRTQITNLLQIAPSANASSGGIMFARMKADGTLEQYWGAYSDIGAVQEGWNSLSFKKDRNASLNGAAWVTGTGTTNPPDECNLYLGECFQGTGNPILITRVMVVPRQITDAENDWWHSKGASGTPITDAVCEPLKTDADFPYATNAFPRSREFGDSQIINGKDKRAYEIMEADQIKDAMHYRDAITTEEHNGLLNWQTTRPTYSLEAAGVLYRLGGSLNAKYSDAVATFVDALVASGDWDHVHDVWGFGLPQTESLIGWKRYQATNNGASHATGTGWSVTGDGPHLAMGVTPATLEQSLGNGVSAAIQVTGTGSSGSNWDLYGSSGDGADWYCRNRFSGEDMQCLLGGDGTTPRLSGVGYPMTGFVFARQTAERYLRNEDLTNSEANAIIAGWSIHEMHVFGRNNGGLNQNGTAATAQMFVLGDSLLNDDNLKAAIADFVSEVA